MCGRCRFDGAQLLSDRHTWGTSNVSTVDHIYAYGYNRYGQCGVDMKDVNLYAPKQVMLDEDEIPVKLACGFQHACCLCESGRVYAWGKANHGQLGRGDVDMTFKPLLVSLE